MAEERTRGDAGGLLVLLRHGQSEGNVEDRFTGWGTKTLPEKAAKRRVTPPGS